MKFRRKSKPQRHGGLQQVEKALDPLSMFEHAYDEMPSHLLAQREELRQELADRKSRNDRSIRR